MQIKNFSTYIYGVLLLCAWLPGVTSASVNQDNFGSAVSGHQNISTMPSVLLAQAEQNAQPQTPPRSGTLVLPEDYEKKEPDKQQSCVRVCNDWGETCVYDNNKGRKCRRTCKETVMECFNR